LFLFVLVSGFITLIVAGSCVHKSQLVVTPDGNFPPDVAKIFLNKCAISGCHNQASYKNASNFLMDTWDHLFNGSQNGAMVVPYSTAYSPLLYRVNTDSSLGFVQPPTMPYSTPSRKMSALTKTEYMTLYNWIQAGAPDKYGNIPFADNAASRQKIYLAHQGADIVAVIDGQRKVIMRYINVGLNPASLEAAHDIECSCDGMSAYLCFYSGNYAQKLDCTRDTVTASLDLNTASGMPGGNSAGSGWSVLNTSLGVDTEIVITNYSGAWMGLMRVNTQTMTASPSDFFPHGSSPDVNYPHGVEQNATSDTFYITNQLGNSIWIYAPYTKPHAYNNLISIDGNTATNDKSSLDPHQIQMIPDFSKYFVSCQASNEVRVMDRLTNKLITTIPVGKYPQEMDLSESMHYLFVACMLDSNANTLPGCKGSVYVINYDTYQVVGVINGYFYQPHDVLVDEQDGYIYVCSTNGSGTGHHLIPGGAPGWYSVFNLSNLAPADNNQYQALILPYALTCRF